MKLPEDLLRPFLCDHLLGEVHKLTTSFIAPARGNKLKAVARGAKLCLRSGFSLRLSLGLKASSGIGTGVPARGLDKLCSFGCAELFMFKLTPLDSFSAPGIRIVKIADPQLSAVPFSATLALACGRSSQLSRLFCKFGSFLGLLLAFARFDLASSSTAGAAPRPIFFGID